VGCVGGCVCGWWVGGWWVCVWVGGGGGGGGGGVGGGGGGGGLIRPQLLNSENIKVMTTKLGGQIVRPKKFALRSAT